MVSSQSRIGTTTAALGFAAWLGSVGASVALESRHGLMELIRCCIDKKMSEKPLKDGG